MLTAMHPGCTRAMRSAKDEDMRVGPEAVDARRLGVDEAGDAGDLELVLPTLRLGQSSALRGTTEMLLRQTFNATEKVLVI